MTVRPARWSDIPALSKVCARAFEDEEMFGEYMFPGRRAHPEGHADWFAKRERRNLFDYEHNPLVAVVREKGPDGTEREVVAGYADWSRKGNIMLNRPWYYPKNLIRPLISTYNSASSFIFPNRAARTDPTPDGLFPIIMPFISQYWAGERANIWFLDCLAIDPAYQGHGLGRKLVRWGLDRAERDRVPANVISSVMGFYFYQKCGFKHVGSVVEGKGNPLSHMKGGKILFTEVKKDA